MAIYTTTEKQWAIWRKETLSVYRWGAAKPEWEFKHPEEPLSIALLSRGVYTLTRKQVLWFPRNRYDPKQSWTAPSARGMQALSPERLLLWDSQGNLLFWDMGRIEKREVSKKPICIGVVQEKRGTVVGDEGGTVYLLDGDTVRSSWKIHAGVITTLVWHPTRTEWLLSAGEDAVITLWDTRTRKYLKAIVGHKGIVVSCAFVAEGRYLLSVDEWGGIYLWDMEKPELPITYTSVDPPVYALQRDEKGSVWLLRESGVLYWDVRERRWTERGGAR